MTNFGLDFSIGNTIRSNFAIPGTVGPDSSTIAGGIGSFIASQFSYWKDLNINRLAIYHTNTSSGSISYNVGICTSLHPHGLFPSNTNNSVSIGNSLNFSAVTNYTVSSSSSNYVSIALDSTYSLAKYENIFLCAQVTARSGTIVGIFNAADFGNFLYNAGKSTINGTTSLTVGPSVPYIIPGYWSGSGDTEWYIDQSTIWSEDGRANNPLTEFGCEFEINDMGLQKIALEEFTWYGLEDYDGNTVYTCKLYDEDTNVIGTAITEKGYNQKFLAASTNEGYYYTFYFIPPINISPNYKYIVGIAGTGYTTTTGQHFTTNNNASVINGIFIQNQVYVYRNSSNSAFQKIDNFTTGNCAFKFNSSKKMRREIGN